jgi:hypothetical protein
MLATRSTGRLIRRSRLRTSWIRLASKRNRPAAKAVLDVLLHEAHVGRGELAIDVVVQQAENCLARRLRLAIGHAACFQPCG